MWHWLAAEFIANGIFRIIENALFNETLILDFSFCRCSRSTAAPQRCLHAAQPSGETLTAKCALVLLHSAAAKKSQSFCIEECKLGIARWKWKVKSFEFRHFELNLQRFKNIFVRKMNLKLLQASNKLIRNFSLPILIFHSWWKINSLKCTSYFGKYYLIIVGFEGNKFWSFVAHVGFIFVWMQNFCQNRYYVKSKS